MKQFVCLILSVSYLMGLNATAQQSDVGATWTAGRSTTDVQITGKQDYSYQSVYVLAGPEQLPQTMLNCSERTGLTAAVFLEPKTIDDIFDSRRVTLKGRNVTMSVDGMEPRKDAWVYKRSAKALNSAKLWQAQRIYNAIVRGVPVDMQISRIGDVTLTFPPVNDDFRWFVENCPALTR